MSNRTQASMQVIVQENGPAFPQEFETLMLDYGYETLRAQLIKLKAEKAVVDLLDAVMMLVTKPAEASWITNQAQFEAMSALTHALVKLGARFLTGSGQIIEPHK